MTIPKQPSEVTVNYLQEKLSDHPWSSKIASISCNDSNIQGQCSLVVRFTLHDEQGNILNQVFIKFAKDENEKSLAHHVDRQFLVATGAYKKEIAFYQYLIKTRSELLLERHVVPPVYLAEIDRNNLDQFVLILAKYGEALDQIVGCPTEQIRLILTSWAMVQSKFWYTAENENEFHAHLIENGLDVIVPIHHSVTSMINKKYNELPIENVIDEVEQLWRTKWEDFHVVLNYFSTVTGLKSLAENAKIISEQVLTGKIFELVKEGCKVFSSNNRTLNHCDLRLDNMLQVTDDCIAIIDFQSICFGNCSFDLSFFISSCLFSEQVNENYDNLMESYWTSLTTNNSQIEKSYSLEELKRDTRKSAILHLSLSVSMFSAWRPMIDSGVDIKEAIGRFFDLVIVSNERMLNFHVQFTSTD